MVARNRLRILHISDLHLGKEAASGWRMRRVMGRTWTENLVQLAADGPIDLVCFTGDLAQSGQVGQYAEATQFVEELLRILKVDRERFFCVPGNHDVDRSVNPPAWKKLRELAWRADGQEFSRWIAGGKPPLGFQKSWPDAVLQRQDAYRAWLASMGLGRFLPGLHPRLGYRVSLDLGLDVPLHIVGLDSAWLAGDDNDAGRLRITDEQVGRLLTNGGKPLPGWCMALVHHPLTDLADGSLVQGLLSHYGVSLLLHGHLHAPKLARWSSPGAHLQIAAAGCLYEHDRYPNCFQVLDVQLPAGQGIALQQLWARTWSANGFWHNDNGLYPGSVDGRLALVAPILPAAQFIPGEFVGRADELAHIGKALLTRPGPAPVRAVQCCVVEGMAGVGKTRLAEHFVRHHWMPALGASADADANNYYQRLLLDPLAPPPSAMELGQQLADRLRSAGPPDTLWARLGAALQAGSGGHGCLLLVENVDSAAQASAVGELVNWLPGCPILVTARYTGLGSGAGWTRIPLGSLRDRDACALLMSEVEPSGHPLTPAEAVELAGQLGNLPLALHIAASHLSLGLAPQAFWDALRREGLGLEPAHPGDPRLTTNRARAILRSSFALSWRQWCAGRGADPLWQQALVALAHGPAAKTGLTLSAAIAGLDEAAYRLFAPGAARLSLLQYTPQGQTSQLHPLLAEFLRGQPGPDVATVRDRLTAWFMPRLPETGNAAQGLAWRQLWDESEALAYWLALLPPDAALAAERAGSALAVGQGPYGTWQALCERLILHFALEPDHLSGLWWTLGQVALRSGDPVRALEAADAKAVLDFARGDDREWALARGTRADVLFMQGALDDALAIWQNELLPVYQRLGDESSWALTRGRIADVLERQGDLGGALKIRRDAVLPVFAKLGDPHNLALAWGQIADVLFEQGDWVEVLRIRREEELPIYETLGDVHSRALTLGRIADVLQARGDLDEALRVRREEELPVYEKLGDVHAKAGTLSQIADVLQARGDGDAALKIWREDVLPAFAHLGDLRSRAAVLGKVADVLLQRGDVDGALRIRREEQLPVYQALGDVMARAQTMGRIAEILQIQGEPDAAVRMLREEALPVYDQLGQRHELLVARWLLLRGRIADRAEASILLVQAYGAARELQLPMAEQIAGFYEDAFQTPLPVAGV
ncbi:metallophosphoesterase [Rhodoferax sp.]|uniref:metallophosphoesterase n=1 Tax=Rhodoferax sp. TaxID=50421 RepID=UPI0025DD1330|nr:metallophosphoesterase [Rhodoferax sp.]